MTVEVYVVRAAYRKVAVYGDVFVEDEIFAFVVVHEVFCALDEYLVLVDEVYRQRYRQNYSHDHDRGNDGDEYAFFLLYRSLLEFGFESFVHFLRAGDGGFGFVDNGGIVVDDVCCFFFFFHILFFLLDLFCGFGRVVLFFAYREQSACFFCARLNRFDGFVHEVGMLVQRDVVREKGVFFLVDAFWHKVFFFVVHFQSSLMNFSIRAQLSP